MMSDLEMTQSLGKRVVVIANDYSYEGWVVAAFEKKRGGLRCVVEDDNGRLFIHNAKQLEHKE